MTGYLSSVGGAGWQFFTDAGTPLAGGKLYTYAAGTTTPATTYNTRACTPGTENANPIVLDAYGRVTDEVWFNVTTNYKFVLKTSLDVTIWTKDNIPGITAADDLATAIAAIRAEMVARYATRAAVKALTSVAGLPVYLTEAGFEGDWIYRTGDYSEQVADDPLEELFFVADDAPATAGAWVHQSPGLTIVPYGFDAAAVQAAVDKCNQVGGWLSFNGRETYTIDDTVWFGTDDAASNIKGIQFNGARIIGAVNHKNLFDLTGIRNGKFQVDGMYMNDSGGAYTPECIFALARPKQAAGVKSSGNVVFTRNVIFANCSAAIIRNASSEANLFDKSNVFFNYHEIGICICVTKSDYLEDCCALLYDNKAGTAFVPGEVLTSATGTAQILHLVQDFGGNAGGCLVWVTAGTFADNQALTGSIGAGTADVNMPNGVYVNGPLSTKPTPHGGEYIEVNTTAAQQDILAYCNAATTTAVAPPIFISDFTDVAVRNASVNVNNANLQLVHWQQDSTKDAANSQGPVGFRSFDNYYHSVHKYSLTFGDPATSGGVELESIILGPERNAGSPGSMTARYKYIGANANYSIRLLRVVADHVVDLVGVRLRYGSAIELTDPTNATVKLGATSAVYASVRCPSACAAHAGWTLPATHSLNFVTVDWTDMGTRTLPPRGVTETIATGVITVERPNFLVDTEGGAAADDLDALNLPTGVPAAGQECTIGTVNAGRVVTVKIGARMLGQADVIMNSTAMRVTLQGESGAGTTAVWSVKCVK